MIPIKLALNKATLNKILIWTSSRWNSRRKKDIVEEIYEGMINGGIYETIWEDMLPYYKNWVDKREIESLNGKKRIQIKFIRKFYQAGIYSDIAGVQEGGDYFIFFNEKRIYRGYFYNNEFNMKNVNAIYQF